MEPASADLLWSLFITALKSYRRDTVLRPFPRGFVNSDGEKDFVKLLEVVDSCPSLKEVNRNPKRLKQSVLELLRWTLNPKNFSLKQLKIENFSDIRKLITNALNDKTNSSTPDAVFEVVYSDTQEQKFVQLRGSSGRLFAFHGSKVENFFSILNNGLRNNLNKVGLYGEGIYLSSDLSIAMNYSPSGSGWENSIFGSSLSCVAVCEMIDHPDVKCSLKYKESENTISKENSLNANAQQDSRTCFTSNTTTERSKISGSEGGEIPEKYFVVRNDDLVRVKYLFLYCPHAHCRNFNQSSASDSLYQRHKFLFSMLAYVMVLFIASVCNSKSIWGSSSFT